jgi:hypothetical protein
VGVILLLSTLGYLGRGPGELIADFWPVALVAVGGWFILGAVLPMGPRRTETLAVSLDGAEEAEIKITFGAGTVTTGVAATGMLVDGSVEGGAVEKRRGPGRIEIEQDVNWGVPWFGARASHRPWPTRVTRPQPGSTNSGHSCDHGRSVTWAIRNTRPRTDQPRAGHERATASVLHGPSIARGVSGPASLPGW